MAKMKEKKKKVANLLLEWTWMESLNPSSVNKQGTGNKYYYILREGKVVQF